MPQASERGGETITGTTNGKTFTVKFFPNGTHAAGPLTTTTVPKK